MKHQFSPRRRNDTRSRRVDRDSYSVICDRTGFRANASDCVLQWNGLFVLKEVAEMRNAQEFIQVLREHIDVPLPRPRQTELEVDQTEAPDWDAY